MIKNNRGIILVEVLSVIALISMVSILASSVHLFSQKQLIRQTSEVENQSNIRLAISTISKDLRSAQTVTVQNNVLTINNTDIYKLEGTILKKNANELVPNIHSFTPGKDGNKITLRIESLPGKNAASVTRTSTIYIRE